MNNISTTKVSPIFGAIRISGTKEKPMFCLSDVCRALDIKNSRDLKTRLYHDGVVLTDGVSETTNQYGVTTSQKVQLTYINEANFYKCVFMSHLPLQRYTEQELFVVKPDYRKGKDGELIQVFTTKITGKNRSKVGIDVVEKIISLKEVDQEFLTNKTILAYLGGVSKEYIKDLRESGVLPYYKVRNTIFYKVSDVRKMVEKNRIIC